MTTLNELTGTYALDASHSEVGFVTRHAMVTKVRGSFTSFSGTATTGANLQDAAIEVSIDVASVDTRSEDRNAHLRSADFFDVETYPTIRFVSTSIEADGDDLTVTGDLTIKDVTRPVTIPFEYNGQIVDAYGATRVGLSGSVQVLRSDFGLTWNVALEAGGVLVSDKVTLEFDIAAVKQ